VARFLVELYVARTDARAVRCGAERSRRAAEALTRAGTPVRYVRSIFVPEDETCFFLYEAASADAVRQAVCGAALTCERVVEAVDQSSSEEIPT
jgi:hypothetical protein